MSELRTRGGIERLAGASEGTLRPDVCMFDTDACKRPAMWPNRALVSESRTRIGIAHSYR